MKVKVTLTIDRKRLTTLRTLSRKRRKTISQLVEEYTDEAAKREQGSEPLFSEKWGGILAGTLTLEQCERDDKLGADLRKTQAYVDLKAATKKKVKA